MKKTKIQWCHSTVNPVMGCDGCELWPGKAQVVAGIQNELELANGLSGERLKAVIRHAVDDRQMSDIYGDRKSIADEIASNFKLSDQVRQKVEDVVRLKAKCYAGLLGSFRAGHKGYADKFETPKLYPGRLAEAANWGPPTEKEIMDKPWLVGLPRLIFISDMGDALSKNIPFEYLNREIIENVNSPSDRQHIWLWLSKRPARMAEFGAWLKNRTINWPDNLVAMTTVTEQRFAQRVNELRHVPSKFKGLSLEPLCGPVDLDLTGIDWVIVGGGSDVLAHEFHIEWSLDLQRQCKRQKIAFFLKQVGKRPFHKGVPIAYENKHGGDWNEWPKAWRVREFPSEFRVSRKASASRSPRLSESRAVIVSQKHANFFKIVRTLANWMASHEEKCVAILPPEQNFFSLYCLIKPPTCNL
jgi:protein gp37